MRLRFGGVALAMVASLGCGRLKPASSDSGVPRGDAAVNDVAPDAPTDASDDISTDTAVPRTGRPLPPGVRGPVRILDETALLMGNGKTACTHQLPASGDGHRWCAVTIGPATAGVASLWVIDVTRAAKGDVPPCDGTDSGCLRLTDKVVTRSATFFEGDTLIYGTDSVAGPTADFLGRVFAWRPGWSAGRQVSSDAGFTCIGNEHSAAAACLDDPSGDPAKRDSANVRVGYLADQTGGALPSVGRFPLRNDAFTAWQAKFSPDGSVFALSNADTIGAKETLRLSPTGTAGQTPTLALDDVVNWQISNDGQKIYFMRGLPQRADLYVADFPSGGAPTLIETGIRRFDLIGEGQGDHALVVIKNRPPGGVVELLSDRQTSTPKTIFTYDDFLEGAIVSPDLKYTTWLDESFRGTVFRNADLTSCVIGGGDDSAVSEISYLQTAPLMFWKEELPGVESPARAFFAPPDDCQDRTLFAQGVEQIKPIGDLGLVFTDEVDPMTRHTTLKYISAASDGATLDPAGAVRVQDGVAGSVVLVGAGAPVVVYNATDASNGTGLYVFGPVPF